MAYTAQRCTAIALKCTKYPRYTFKTNHRGALIQCSASIVGDTKKQDATTFILSTFSPATSTNAKRPGKDKHNPSVNSRIKKRSSTVERREGQILAQNLESKAFSSVIDKDQYIRAIQSQIISIKQRGQQQQQQGEQPTEGVDVAANGVQSAAVSSVAEAVNQIGQQVVNQQQQQQGSQQIQPGQPGQEQVRSRKLKKGINLDNGGTRHDYKNDTGKSD